MEKENKVEFGLKNVHVAPLTFDGTKYTYSEIFKLPGAVNLTLNPSGDSSDFYADDIVYYSGTANNGYEGELEFARITNSFREKILNEIKDAAGAFIEDASLDINPFALGFEIDGDVSKKRIWLYNCTCGRPSTEASTKQNTKEPKTSKASFKALPRSTDNLVKTVLIPNETNKSAYDSFFSKVYEKTETL